MIIETEKFNIVCDKLTKIAEQEQITPEQHGEALDLLTQATVLQAEINAAASEAISEKSAAIDAVEVVVEEPDDIDEPADDEGEAEGAGRDKKTPPGQEKK